MFFKMCFKKAISTLLVCLLVFGSADICVYALEENQHENWINKAATSFADEEGNGTKEKPYKIQSAKELALFAKTVNECTVPKAEFYAQLEKDIELNDTADWESRWSTDGSDKEVFNSSGLIEWTPIAPAKDIYFSDYSHNDLKSNCLNIIHFDGNNHTIYGLFIDKDFSDDRENGENYLGLFSIGFSAASSYKNINIEKSYIRGGYSAGGVAGYSYAEIDNCTVDAFVESSNSVGGIAGYGYRISNCTNKGTISGSQKAGGIAGDAYTVSHCTNQGSVSGTQEIGGIAGLVTVVSNCANKGNISGTQLVGGIAGKTEKAQVCSNQGTVSGQIEIGGISGAGFSTAQCYNSGRITGITDDSEKIGGIAGRGFVYECYNIGSVTGMKIDPICVTKLNEDFSFYGDASYSLNCYYLDEPGLYSGEISSSATALKAVEMSKEFNYTNWGFDTVWTIPEGGFPRLIQETVTQEDIEAYYKDNPNSWKGEIAESFAGGDGTSEAPYEIHTAAQLAYLAKMVNEGSDCADKYFSLEADIDFNNTDDKRWVACAAEWIPIGEKIQAFSGCFDGRGHYISGLKSSSDGLFSYTSHGSIKNLSVKNAHISGAYQVGGISGDAWYSNFENCSFSGVIHASSYAGGIVGWSMDCEYTKCRNQGNIFAAEQSGGIVGYCFNSDIHLSCNTGRVVGAADMGGIAGYVVEDHVIAPPVIVPPSPPGYPPTEPVVTPANIIQTAERCFNSGYVFAVMDVGGIVGGNGGGSSVDNCYNSGQISCLLGWCGGIISGGGTISNCYNCGIVSVEMNSAQASSLQKTVDEIMEHGNVGCIAGHARTIENCFFLENNFCQKGSGSSDGSADTQPVKLTAREMQRVKSKRENGLPESWFSGEDAAWTLDTEGEGFSNAYLFPQIRYTEKDETSQQETVKVLSHVPGNQYTFSFARFTDKNKNEKGSASVSPYVFSNELCYFTNDAIRIEGIYEQLFDRALFRIGRIKDFVEAIALSVTNLLFGPKYGFCFGMSSVMMLHMLNWIEVKDFQWRAKEPFDFLSPVNSNTIESLISYFQLFQNIISAKKPVDFKGLAKKRDEKTSDTIKELNTALTSKKNNCVMLRKCFDVAHDNVIHWVVAYDIDRLDAFDDTKGEIGDTVGTVGIWDPNKSQSVSEMSFTITGKDKEGNNLYGIVGDNSFSLAEIITVNDLEDAFDLLKNNVSSLNLDSFSSRRAAFAPPKTVSAQSEEDDPAVTTLISGYDSFTIEDDNGNKATIKDGVVQGSSTLISNGLPIGENIPLYQFILSENSGTYMIDSLENTQTENSDHAHIMAICCEANNWYSIVDAEDLESITFVLADQSVETSSGQQGTAQRVVSGFAPDASVDSTSWNRIELSGDTTGITTSMDETEYSFSSDSKAITVKASDGINETDGYTIKDVTSDQKITISEETENNNQKTREMTFTTETKSVRAQRIKRKTVSDNDNNDATLGFTVFFVSGTDKGNKSVSVKPGMTVENPGVPEDADNYPDYSFRGWWYKDDSTGRWSEWDFTAGIQRNVRLVAKWDDTPIDDTEICAPVTASLPTGSTADEGRAVTLTTTTPGAQIYYTTDGTDPCIEDNPSRVRYSGPIILTENVRIIACAVKDGWYDSEMTILNYTVIPKTYTITWYIDGDVIIQTVAHGAMIEKIDDPVKAGYTFKGWSSPVPETMPAYDLTFTAVFEQEQPTIAIRNYTQNRTVDYFTTITFTAEVQNPVSGAEIRWIVGDQVMGTDDTFTMKRADKTFTVQAQYVKNDRVLAESEAETVTVRTSFLAKLIAFIRALLGRLPIVVQEYLGVEIIDRVLT